MASQLEQAYKNFEKMKPAQRKDLDDALSFLTIAKMPTEQGARNRELLKTQPLDPSAVKAIGAYKAFRFKLAHSPMDASQRNMMKLQNVPDSEIDAVDSKDKWENDQLNTFTDLIPATDAKVMEPEVITASVPKKKAAPKMERVVPVRSMEAAPAGVEGAPLAGPPPAAPAPVLYAAPPEVNQEYKPIGAMLNQGGQIV